MITNQFIIKHYEDTSLFQTELGAGLHGTVGTCTYIVTKLMIGCTSCTEINQLTFSASQTNDFGKYLLQALIFYDCITQEHTLRNKKITFCFISGRVVTHGSEQVMLLAGG